MKFSLRIALISVLCVFSFALLSACGGSDGDAKPTLYPYDPGAAFTTNIKGSKKMLKCSVMFRLSDKDSATSFAEQNDIIRDSVIKVLVNLTEDEVLTYLDTDALKIRLVESANAAMETTYFVEAYFTEFAAA